jgi:hypothetical protein
MLRQNGRERLEICSLMPKLSFARLPLTAAGEVFAASNFRPIPAVFRKRGGPATFRIPLQLNRA